MEQYTDRKYIIGGIILLVGLILTIRLFYLQVIDHSSKLSAESNSKRMEIIYPARGLIYDRKGRMLAHNQPSYDLKIAPYELESFDSAALCQILNIDIQTLRDGIRRVKKYERERFNPFIKQLSPETYGRLKEQQYKFPGFYFSKRTLRKYDFEIASHLLGYVGEVDSNNIKQDDYYELGDYYGVSGIELTYERYLRGEKGRQYKLMDVHGREQGKYNEGKYNSDAESGKNLNITIDALLQQYGEQLMQGYKGSIVAIEPKTGEVLALISAPSYDPSLLVGRDRQLNYKLLLNDSLNPLFNHAIQATYPPGSTFKTLNALIGLQENDLVPQTSFGCSMGFHTHGISVACHSHPTPLNLVHSIQNSCNAYYCNAYLKILNDPDYGSTEEAYNMWRNYAVNFGFSDPLGIDLPYEKGGLIPKSTYFDRYYGKGRWKPLTIISMSIGQGEVLATPLQIANLAAIIANKGYFYTPRVIKKIEGVDTLNSQYLQKRYTGVDSSYFNYIIDGMELAVNESPGTALIAKHPNIVICGKTGTAQNPHGEAHSVFMAFAPKDNPQIAIAVYVEHGKWGASYAAPIASLMIEKYLTDSIIPERKYLETRMMEGNLLNLK